MLQALPQKAKKIKKQQLRVCSWPSIRDTGLPSLSGNVQLPLACRFRPRPQILSQVPWGAMDDARLGEDRQASCTPRARHSDLSGSVRARV